MADEEMREAADRHTSDDSSSDDSASEVDVSEEDSARIMELEAALEENPNQYDTHVQLLEVLRRCGMKARLREARLAMHAHFPLSESLWLDWIGDELEGISGEEDIPRIRELMEAAVADYLSISLWLQLLGFVRELDPEVAGRTPEGLARVRDLCERALTAGGLHLGEGGKFWEAYRGFEEALLEESPSTEQAERVRALFHRQLAVPLADGAQTLEAYKSWEQAQAGEGATEFEVPAHVAAAHAKAQHLAELRLPYEAAVTPEHAADAELLAGYMAYIKAEEAHGDPARVQVLFERALAVFPVTHYLWLQYARYLEQHLKIPVLINRVYERAVRNCPWVGELWGSYLRALERGGCSEEEHASAYAKALAAGLQTYEEALEVHLARLDFLRRHGDTEPLRATFQEASKQLAAAFPDVLDRTYRLPQYWAECEAKAGDMKAARAVWEAVVKTPLGRYADCWAGYVDMERRRGNVREARGLYKRCYSRKLEEGGQQLVCQAWLRFEREEGSAEDYFAAWTKVEPILAEAQAVQAAAEASAAAAAEARAAAARAPKLTQEEKKRLRQQNDPNYGKKRGGQKREAAAEDEGAMPPPAKKAKPAAITQQQQQQEQQQQRAAAAKAAAAAVGGGDARKPAAAEAEGAQQQQQQPAEGGHVTAKGLRKTGPSTVFVKYLADEVDETGLEALFSPCGNITALKLGRDDSGRSRGFAYVEFSSEAEMQKACELSGQELHGKRILVAHSQPPAGPGGRGRGRGGRGDFGGGRGGRGRGFSGPERGGRGGRGASSHQRAHLDLSSPPPASSKPATAFMPRSAALHRGGGAAGGGGGGDGAPKSNADFRKMMLGGK